MPPYPPYGPPPTLVRRLREDEWPPLGQFLSGLRLHGCLWALAAMCAWPMVVGLLVGYPLARSARRPARRVGAGAPRPPAGARGAPGLVAAAEKKE
ncbi:hypothetical protein PV439_32755, partial [Streptomyces scabiei]|nr:hypothetical protein [Streptomyces scabiei]